MKKLLLLLILFLTACGSTEPSFPVNEYPTPFPTPTLAVVTKPMGDAERDAAREFFYHLKVHMLSVEFEHVAEEVRYPITVMVDGQPKTYVQIAGFAEDFHKIFAEEKIRAVTAVSESDLEFTPQGVNVADVLFFDYICMDPDCNEPVFLITQIN